MPTEHQSQSGRRDFLKFSGLIAPIALVSKQLLAQLDPGREGGGGDRTSAPTESELRTEYDVFLGDGVITTNGKSIPTMAAATAKVSNYGPGEILVRIDEPMVGDFQQNGRQMEIVPQIVDSYIGKEDGQNHRQFYGFGQIPSAILSRSRRAVALNQTGPETGHVDLHVQDIGGLPAHRLVFSRTLLYEPIVAVAVKKFHFVRNAPADVAGGAKVAMIVSPEKPVALELPEVLGGQVQYKVDILAKGYPYEVTPDGKLVKVDFLDGRGLTPAFERNDETGEYDIREYHINRPVNMDDLIFRTITGGSSARAVQEQPTRPTQFHVKFLPGKLTIIARRDEDNNILPGHIVFTEAHTRSRKDNTEQVLPIVLQADLGDGKNGMYPSLSASSFFDIADAYPPNSAFTSTFSKDQSKFKDHDGGYRKLVFDNIPMYKNYYDNDIIPSRALFFGYIQTKNIY